MGVTDDVLRKKKKRMTEGELCESVECSGKNKEQKRVKEKNRKEGKKKKKSKCIFLEKKKNEKGNWNVLSLEEVIGCKRGK